MPQNWLGLDVGAHHKEIIIMWCHRAGCDCWRGKPKSSNNNTIHITDLNIYHMNMDMLKILNIKLRVILDQNKHLTSLTEIIISIYKEPVIMLFTGTLQSHIYNIVISSST